MPSRFPAPALLAFTLALAAPALAAEDFVHLVEAENREANTASVTVASDDAASGGSFAEAHGGYQPLFTGEWPAQEAERLTVWARVRGHAIQLKARTPDGKQTEFGWNWSRPAAWRWVSLGTHERGKLGVGFVIIRAADGPADAGLDAVIVTNDPNFRPVDPKP